MTWLPPHALLDSALFFWCTLSSVFLVYVLVLLPHLLVCRVSEPGDPRDFDWHFFIPCRDEEAVVGGSLAYLRANFPSVQLWVVDDGSEDATGRIVRLLATADPHVHLVTRRRPEARTGKGDALNAAYRALDHWLAPDTRRDRVVVAVFDADGRPAPNCLAVCAGPRLFGDEDVSAVQIEVRMLNRDERRPVPTHGPMRSLLARTLVRLQDIEFRAAIAAIQLTRGRSRTVALGGNGQFSRLSGLDRVDAGSGQPWRGSLLEDFELGLHLHLAGLGVRYSADTWVDQEGLWSLRRFLAQRTRWAQGTMQCMRYLRRLWASPHVSLLGKLEASYFLFQPWLLLVGSVLSPLIVVTSLWGVDGGWGNGSVRAASGMALLSFMPFVVWGPAYRWRCEPGVTHWRAWGWGLSYAATMTYLYLTAWRALGRILSGRDGWAKTRRNADTVFRGAAAEDR